jgi:hypothetical protein
MAIKLNKSGFDYAKKLVQEGQFTWDQRVAWSEHQPSTGSRGTFLDLPLISIKETIGNS